MTNGTNGHQNDTSGEYTYRNRLAGEKSPYLLQHAGNPVDWFPWGEEAFARAAAEDKPVFLSIGYSSCHWCHVMEEESFEDENVAALLNEHFISIKVDREERPDIDHIYMLVCQVMTGSGGWPLTIIMTPDRKPFFAGTYIPKQDHHGRVGLVELLPHIADLWREDRAELLRMGDRAGEFLARSHETGGGSAPGEALLRGALDHFRESFDEEWGGFGTEPKFPSPHQISLLLRLWKRTGDAQALDIATHTLTAMHRGGIFDQLGYGFHRYSTDRRWLVPHFEKMLYDQAMLAIAYLEAYQATGHAAFGDAARQIFTYVFNEMTSPAGGFYSSEDADSEGREGKYYLWRPEEIREVLGDGSGGLAGRYYGATGHGHLDGGSVLHVARDAGRFAVEEGIEPDRLAADIEEARKKLLAARASRVHPAKDDKILTDWNGLMIVSLARGAQVLGEAEYAVAASRAADFILSSLRRPDGRLLHRYRDGEAAIPAFLDDYAFLSWGLIELYGATFEPRRLKEALGLTREMTDLFHDDERGGFYLTGADAEKLPARPVDIYDGAIPSGNSVAALNLLRLGRMTMNRDLEERAERLLERFEGTASAGPAAFSQLLIALDFALGSTREIVMAGDPASPVAAAMLGAVRGRFMPCTVVIVAGEGRAREEMLALVPALEHMIGADGRPTAYVCENFTCKVPVHDAEALGALLDE